MRGLKHFTALPSRREGLPLDHRSFFSRSHSGLLQPNARFLRVQLLTHLTARDWTFDRLWLDRIRAGRARLTMIGECLGARRFNEMANRFSIVSVHNHFGTHGLRDVRDVSRQTKCRVGGGIGRADCLRASSAAKQKRSQDKRRTHKNLVNDGPDLAFFSKRRRSGQN